MSGPSDSPKVRENRFKAPHDILNAADAAAVAKRLSQLPFANHAVIYLDGCRVGKLPWMGVFVRTLRQKYPDIQVMATDKYCWMGSSAILDNVYLSEEFGQKGSPVPVQKAFRPIPPAPE